MFSPRVSVIVPTHERPRYLDAALRSLFTQKFGGEWEIIVVDNSREGGVRQLVEELQAIFPALRFIHEPNPGLHRARHAGAKSAQFPLLAYVDDDVLTPENWLDSLVAPFADERVAMVGGKVWPRWEVAPPDPLPCPDTYLSLMDLGDDARELHWPEGVFGCNMAVRREVVFEVGGFHPDGMGSQRLQWLRGDGETGFHHKVFAAGYKVIYQPEAALYHQIPARRLEVSALQTRAFHQGISDSFSFARGNRGLYRRARHFVASSLRALKWFVLSRRTGTVAARLSASYFAGMAQHQGRVLLWPPLRAHVWRDDYFDA